MCFAPAFLQTKRVYVYHDKKERLAMLPLSALQNFCRMSRSMAFLCEMLLKKERLLPCNYGKLQLRTFLL